MNKTEKNQRKIKEPAILVKLENERESLTNFNSQNIFLFVKNGSMNLKIGQEDFFAETKNIVFVPALVPFSYKASDDSEIWSLYVDEKYFADFYDCYPDKSLNTVMDKKEFNVYLFNYVRREYSSKKLTELEKIACANYVLGKLSATYGVIERVVLGDSQIAEIIRYVYKNYDKDVTLDSLAQEFVMSKMVLSRKLSKYIGVDLRKFVSDVRLRAYMKMRNDKKYANLSSVELAYKCGFKSYETFYRAYKRQQSSKSEEE